MCIFQDENFGLWIGTQDGLNRFDGKRFEVFTSYDIKGLEGNYIRSSLKSPNGILWFGTTNGLTSFDPKTEQFITYKEGKEELSIEQIALDKNNNLWMTTSTKGVWMFNLKTKKFSSQNEIFKGSNVTNIAVTDDNSVLVSSADRDLQVYNINSKKYHEVPLKSKNKTPVLIFSLNEYDKGRVVLGTSQGVYEYNLTDNSTSKKFVEFDKSFGYMGVSSILRTASNNWYVGTTNNGLFTIRADGRIYNSTQDIFQKHALLFDQISCLYQDKTGTIWVGSGRGISSFNPENQGFLGVGASGNVEHGIPSPSVWSIKEDTVSKNVYIGTDVGVSCLNPLTGKLQQYYRNNQQSVNQEVSESAVLAIEILNRNKLLTACVDGLFELTITGKSTYSFKHLDYINTKTKEDHSRVYRIKKYKDNMYFVATKSGVLLVDAIKKTVNEFVHDELNPQNSIKPGICRMIYQSKNGQFFFATSTGGLNVLNNENPDSLFIYPHKDNYKFKNVLGYFTDMVETSKGNYWLGTLGSGIVNWRIKSSKITTYVKEDGLPNNTVYNILVDSKRKLWLSTNKGICCFDPTNKTIKTYTEVHGLLSNEFNMGAAAKMSNGDLYFGGISGFNFFNPVSLSGLNMRSNVVFTKFKLDKGWLQTTSKNSPLTDAISRLTEINLSYNQRSFTIRFQPTNLTNPSLLNYKYILEGTNEGEIELGNTNELRFTSLSSGNYVLKVYARIGEGEWSEVPATLKINIAAPLWNKWWFWALVAIALFFIIRFGIKQRIQLEKREQIRLELKIAERTREIREKTIKIEKQKEQIERKNEKVERQRKQLQIEKEKSEKLLRNVIPDSMATELLETGEASARSFKIVSVLFTDFVGFTKIADGMNPTDLVKKLDIYFRKFDEIVFSNNLEKIKTIGDAYMCAGGVPVRNNTNPIDACIAGLQIQHYMKSLELEAKDGGEETWSLRLGINTGDVIAGVIGSKRLAYDVWGATVNHAQRMEMMGKPGEVTISKNTFLHIEPYFECQYLGRIETKSKGKMETYRVLRIKPELSIDGNGIYPNERFHQIVNLHHFSSINYYKAERFIMKQLEEQLSDKLHYHSIAHTRDVVKAVERLALSENVTDEGLFLLKTAATYHDAGFVEQYEKNEPIGVRLASEILPKYGYTPEHIETIKNLIHVTAIPHQPMNQLEEIICDADLDYLGRDDFHEIADRLRQELKEHGKIDSDRKWDEIQVHFLTQHRYFTKTAIDTRRVKKLKNLEEIKQKLLNFTYLD